MGAKNGRVLVGFWEILEGSLSGKFEREGFLTIGIILKMMMMELNVER